MQIAGHPFGVGALIALIVLVVSIILYLVGDYSRDALLALIGTLAVARLIP